MSVVPMQKVRLVVHVDDVDKVLNIIQRVSAVEFRTAAIEGKASNLQFPHAQLLPRVLHGVQFLEPYAVKKGLWKTLREGSLAELTEKDVERIINDTDVAQAIVDDLEQLQVEFADTTEKVRLLGEKHQLLLSWKGLPIRLADLTTEKTQTFLISNIHATEKETLESVLSAKLDGAVPFLVTPASTTQCAITMEKTDAAIAAVKTVVEETGSQIVTLPEGIETPEVEFVAVSDALAKAKGDLALLHDQAEHFAITHHNRLQIIGEVLHWQKERYDVVGEAAATMRTAVFDGWLNGGKRKQIEAEIEEQKLGAVFAELETVEGEEPPVDIENPALIRPFEAVTRLYGMPGYTDLDPTVFLAGFFFLFFGLCLTDVGYGLALVVASLFLLFFCKISDATRSFAKLLLFIGSATVLVGALFGGYLGVDPSLLPEPLQKIQKFDPVGNPLPVFYLALSLGVFQVMVGMMLKIYSEARNNRFVDGLLDQGPWLAMFGIGILYILTQIGYVDVLPTSVIGNLAIVDAAIIFIASGRNGEGILGKFLSAFAGLYAGVGHFSDILSYSRLLALGLATSALAFAVNLIASMVAGVPYIGFLLAAIILIIGHLFTLAINTLGAFIHSARLQFVEFFGKFISGTGKEFSPLKRSKKYVSITDD